MAKMSELDLCITELRKVAQAMNLIADSLTALFSGNGGTTESPVPKAETKPEPKPIKLETVRAALAEKSRAGHTAEVRELLQKHGAAKLSEIDPSHYADLLKEAEGLGNG
jgi:hypothetical protein